MPCTLVRAPGHDRRRSLGWLGLAWTEYFVRHGPGDVMGQPVVHTDEQAGFFADCYALGDEPSNNHRLYDSAFWSRPKGCDKSGQGARFGLFEAFGPARFAGWARGGEVYRDPWGLGFVYRYAPGEPMGAPVRAPFVRIMATEIGQTGNVYQTILFNLTDYDCPLAHVPGHDAGVEKVLLPFGGEIRTSTAAAASKDGGLETWTCFDETHVYDSPELRDMYDVVRQNMVKRKKTAGTWYLETTTMYAPGSNSIAEATYGEAQALLEGRKKRGRHRLLADHRWGECDDLRDEAALRAALVEAYGGAMAWMDLDGLIDQAYDTRTDPAKFRRYFLNAITSVSDAWVAPHEWAACKRPDLRLQPQDLVCLGLDGSINDDATALVACRVSDGHLQLLGLWEKPEGPQGEGWRVDTEDVDAAVAHAMATYEVAGFYLDPPHFQDLADRWHREFAAKMQVKATAGRPLEWWTNRPRAMVPALERFHEAILAKRLSYTPADDCGTEDEQRLARALARHVGNARRRPSRAGLQIGKEHPHSPKKIDAAVAATLAYECRNDAVAAGARPRGDMVYAAKRIR
jgi:hypothetical protein